MSSDAPKPTEHAQGMIGKVITWTRTAPTFRSAKGVCTAVERIPGMTITTDDGTFPAVRFRIKPSDGGRAVWTDAFADEPDGEAAGATRPTQEDEAK